MWKLKGDGRVAQTKNAFGDVHMAEDEAGVDMLAMNLQEQVKVKKAELDAMKNKYMNMFYVFIMFVLGLVLAKFVV